MNTEAPSATMLLAFTRMLPVAATMPPLTVSLPSVGETPVVSTTSITMFAALSKPLSPPTKPLSVQFFVKPIWMSRNARNWKLEAWNEGVLMAMLPVSTDT